MVFGGFGERNDRLPSRYSESRRLDMVILSQMSLSIGGSNWRWMIHYLLLSPRQSQSKSLILSLQWLLVVLAPKQRCRLEHMFLAYRAESLDYYWLEADSVTVHYENCWITRRRMKCIANTRTVSGRVPHEIWLASKATGDPHKLGTSLPSVQCKHNASQPRPCICHTACVRRIIKVLFPESVHS